MKPSDINDRKPFYEVMRSPAQEKLKIQCVEVAKEDQNRWDKDGSMTAVEFGDSRVYIDSRAPRTMTILLLDLPPPWRDARFQC
jgi:hypothetical protein